MKLLNFKKGQQAQGITALASIIILLIIIGIVTVFGIDMTDDVDTSKLCLVKGLNASATWNEALSRCENSSNGIGGVHPSAMGNSTINAQGGLANISAKFSLLGTIVIVGVILSALTGFLVFRRFS